MIACKFCKYQKLYSAKCANGIDAIRQGYFQCYKYVRNVVSPTNGENMLLVG